MTLIFYFRLRCLFLRVDLAPSDAKSDCSGDFKNGGPITYGFGPPLLEVFERGKRLKKNDLGLECKNLPKILIKR